MLLETSKNVSSTLKQNGNIIKTEKKSQQAMELHDTTSVKRATIKQGKHAKYNAF